MVQLTKNDLKSNHNRPLRSTRSRSSSIGITFCRFILLIIALVCLWLFGVFNFLLQSNPELDAKNKELITAAKLKFKAVTDTNALRRTNKKERLIRKVRQKPSQPLCEECLSIVQQAQPIDISYVDVRANMTKPLEFPHRGARDENGNWNYVADETALRNNPPEYNFPNLRQACSNRDSNYQMIHKKIIVEKDYVSSTKIFCLVYTISTGHAGLQNIRETWGPKCDGFIVGSNATDKNVNAVDIPHEGEEAYNNIWQKVRSMWSYVYDNYYDKYDWFHIGGDDLFLIVENLKYYLDSDEIRTAANGGIYLSVGNETIQTPLFLGRRFAYMGDRDEIFNSGGSGYTMNKAALKTLVVHAFPKYAPHAHTFSEDTMVARLLKKYGILPYETKDENGGERYMPFNPGHHYTYRLPANNPEGDWYAKYSINIKEGLDHCAARSIAFHYIKGDVMRRLFALLYGLCPPDTLLDEPEDGTAN